MRWDFGRRSRNVEDRRGRGGAGVPIVGGGIGAVLLALLVALLGGDPSAIFEQVQSPSNVQTDQPRTPGQDQQADFVSVVLASTEDTWGALFQQAGERYVDPRLVIFDNVVDSACGTAESALGPFYCPRDQSVYIDLSFFNDMRTQLNAPGDFAQAYVIAHEVGHHVQNLLGISDEVQALRQRVGRTEGNQLMVRLELQADCFAGVWAHHADRNRIGIALEPGDVEEALNAASQIGDDRLQERARGYSVPDSFTHGTSAQRVRWFRQGFQTGNPDQCNTFEVANP
jgi:hypothetical protein